MRFTGFVVTVYGLLVVTGGLIGYLTANSLPSLIAGSVSGALLFASGLGLYRTSVVAFFTALAVTLVLTLFFAVRFYLTRQVMPVGMMAILSFTVLLLILTTKGRPRKNTV